MINNKIVSKTEFSSVMSIVQRLTAKSLFVPLVPIVPKVPKIFTAKTIRTNS
jgi:hypothetical protein